MTRKNIPFSFVFDYLVPPDVTVKPIFGLWAIYVNGKIMPDMRFAAYCRYFKHDYAEADRHN